MLNLESLQNIISHSDIYYAKNVMGFAEYNPNYVFGIVVKTSKDLPVSIWVGDEVVEVGIPINGVYLVDLFRNTPFPYAMFPFVEIKCDAPFVIDYQFCDFDILMLHTIYRLGVYFKMLNGKYILMRGNNLMLSDTKNTDIKSKIDVSGSCVIECEDFPSIIQTSDFEWMAPFVIPGAGKHYIAIAKELLGYQYDIPCVLLKKEKADEVVGSLRLRFPEYNFRISEKSAKRVFKRNKSFLKDILKHLNSNFKSSKRHSASRSVNEDAPQ